MSTYLGVMELHATYADIASRRAWPEMTTIVRPDAPFTFSFGAGDPVELMGPEQLAEFGQTATAAFDFYSYQPLNVVLTDDRDTSASGRFYAREVATLTPSGEWTELYGLYDDEYMWFDGRWWFAQRRFRVLAQRP